MSAYRTYNLPTSEYEKHAIIKKN